MPTYAYTCTSDPAHVMEIACRMADKVPEMPCSLCGAPARDRGVYAVHTTLHEGQARLDTGPAVVTERGTTSHDIRSIDLECLGCGKAYEDVYDAVKEAPAACPHCGGEGRVLVAAPGAAHMNEYPRYDRGLGIWLKSESHRQQVCKERGLTPVDGDFDDERIMGAIEADNRRDLEAFEDYQRRLEESPEYREFRELRDKGRYDEVTKRAPPSTPIERPLRRMPR